MRLVEYPSRSSRNIAVCNDDTMANAAMNYAGVKNRK